VTLRDDQAAGRVPRTAGWGLSRDAARLHLARLLRSAVGAGLGPAAALRSAVTGSEPGRPPGFARLAPSLEPALVELEAGAALSEALSATRRFQGWEIALLQAGERSGRLGEALSAWAEALRVRAVVRRALPSLLVYPLAVALVAAGVVTVIGWKVLPTLATILTAAGVEFPAPARWAIASARLTAEAVPLLVVVLALGALLLGLLRAAGGGATRAADRLALRLPLWGAAERATARALGLQVVAAALEAGDDEAAALRAAAAAQPTALGRAEWERGADEVASGARPRPGGGVVLDAGTIRRLDRALASRDPVPPLRRQARREIDAWWRRFDRAVLLGEPVLLLLIGLFLAVQVTGWWTAVFSATSAVQP
jgi:hypothetical protein